MSVAEPRWDRDLEYGRQGELQIGEYLQWIADRNGRVEFKRKRRLDFELYVEEECDKGRTGKYEPSGINVTQADVWAYCIADTGITIFVPTWRLRVALNHKSTRYCEEKDGDCPTRGRLVNLAAVLSAARDSQDGRPQLGGIA